MNAYAMVRCDALVPVFIPRPFNIADTTMRLYMLHSFSSDPFLCFFNARKKEVMLWAKYLLILFPPSSLLSSLESPYVCLSRRQIKSSRSRCFVRLGVDFRKFRTVFSKLIKSHFSCTLSMH